MSIGQALVIIRQACYHNNGAHAHQAACYENRSLLSARSYDNRPGRMVIGQPLISFEQAVIIGVGCRDNMDDNRPSLAIVSKGLLV